MENYFFLENYVTSEGDVSHNVLYYQQLSIACFQVSFYANVEYLPIVSTALKQRELSSSGYTLRITADLIWRQAPSLCFMMVEKQKTCRIDCIAQGEWHLVINWASFPPLCPTY